MTNNKQRSLLVVATLLALATPVAAFSISNPSHVQTRTGASTHPSFFRPTRLDNSQTLLHTYRNNKDDNDLGDDWRAFAHAAGNLARKVGGKVYDWVEQGVEKVKSALAPAYKTTPPTARSPLSRIFEDREDEALFNSIFGEGIFVPSTSAMESVDRVIDQAATLLRKNPTAISLLGPNLRFGRPFSQSSSTTSINGRTTSTVQASFDVWGSQGQGVASVTSSDGNLQNVDLDVNGRLYRFNASSNKDTRQNTKATRAGTTDSVDVEILPGIQRRGTFGGGFVDAEIEDKETMW